ncbi:hypothetical protein D3C76_1430920 [compost metagenome]
MEGIPPFDREVNNRNVDHPHQHQNTGGSPGQAAIVESVIQSNDAHIKEQQHQLRGQACVPHPPGAPHRFAPGRSGDQCNKGEHRADRSHGRDHGIGHFHLPDQADKRRYRH